MRYLCVLLGLATLLCASAEPVSATVNIKLAKTIDLQRTTRQPNALVADGRFIYVTDKSGGLNKYDTEGTLVTELKRINGEFFIAGDLAQDNEYLYLTDEISKRIIKLNKKMDLSTAYALNTTELDLFTPAGIYIDKNQDIYLSDSARDQVYCLNAFGILEWRKGIFGEAAQSLNNPKALAMYRNNLVVLDSGNQALKSVSAERIDFLAAYTKPLSLAAYKNQLFVGTQAGIFTYPSDTLLDTPQTNYPEDLFVLNNFLYVLDSQQRKILIYEIY